MSAVLQDERRAHVSAMIAGPCATFLGVGVARFAYAPLVPAMVGAGWLSAGAAGVLGAVNFGGYLCGALLAPALARRFGAVRTLRLIMLLTALALAPCALRGDLAWFLPWRILSGATGGVLMVLAGPTVQAFLPPRLRGLSAGLMFTGVGAGSVIGALIVPTLLPYGLPAAWLALSATGLIVTAAAWTLWPRAPVATVAPSRTAAPVPIWSRGAIALVTCYGLCGVAAAPHMQWWPDFVARGLGEGVAAGARSWLVWSLAAAGAPVLLGRLADLIGGRRALIFGLVLQALGPAGAVAGHEPAVATRLRHSRRRDHDSHQRPDPDPHARVGWRGVGAVVERVHVLLCRKPDGGGVLPGVAVHGDGESSAVVCDGVRGGGGGVFSGEEVRPGLCPGPTRASGPGPHFSQRASSTRPFVRNAVQGRWLWWRSRGATPLGLTSYPKGGRISCHAVARSYARATRSSSASSQYRPTS